MRPLASTILFAGLLSAYGSVLGQDKPPGRIQGYVLDDATGAAVPEALVYLNGGPKTRANGGGVFVFGEVTPGRYEIAAVGPGCATAVGVVSVQPAQVLSVTLRIVPLFVAATQVPKEGWTQTPALSGAWADVITADEIRASTSANLLDLLRARVPGLMGGVSAGSDEVGRLRGRGNNTATQSTEPILILDGARIQRRPAEVLSQMGLDQVTRVEVYRGSAGAWVYGPGSANGVIRVFTRSSAAAAVAQLDPEECGDPFRIR